MTDSLVIAGRTFSSRLIVGTGKYPSHAIMKAAHEASGTDMVTVAVRRVDISRKTESLLDYVDTSKIFLLPNTATCYTADDAIRTARLGREAGMSNWVKLEVIGDELTLFPDNEGLLEATRVLVKEGFVVLPYTNDDPVMCRKLADAGAAAVMPLGAPIGSGRRWRADEYRDRRREGSGGDGAGDEAGGRSGPPGISRRQNSEEVLRQREQPARGRNRLLGRARVVDGIRQRRRDLGPLQ